jgi:hypothetical protein
MKIRHLGQFTPTKINFEKITIFYGNISMEIGTLENKFSWIYGTMTRGRGDR